MSAVKPILGEVEAVLRLPYTIPRPKPTPIPTPHIFDDPKVCFSINTEWASHVIGVLDALDQPDTWIGTEEQIEDARQQVREAILVLSGECEMCCEDEIILLEQLRVIQETIVTNQLVTIEQNTTQILSQYQQQVDNWVTNNHNASTYLNQIYDGNPQSISTNLGENFDTTGDDMLCAAIKRYIENIIGNYTAMINLGAAAAGLIGGVVATAIIAATLGAAAPLIGAWGTILSAVSFSTLAAWNIAAQDNEAKRKVFCCMYDSLVGQALSEATFIGAVTDCSFDPTSNEGRLAGLINDRANHDNYLAFLSMLGQETGGNAGDCVCDCEDGAEMVTTGVFGNTVEYMGNCIWRSVQLTPVYEEPAIEVARYYHEWKDVLDRCFHAEQVPFGHEFATVPTSDWFATSCAGVESGGVGGGGGDQKKQGWRMGIGPQYYKITLV